MIDFHSDDFGYNETNDEKLLQYLEDGLLKSVSVLATMVKPDMLARLQALQVRKSFAVSLHANLIEGKSMLKPETVPSLVSHHNTFYSLPHFFANLMLGKVHKEELRDELEHQLAFLIHNGLKVTIIDSHQHTHALSPVAETVIVLAKKYNIEHIRTYGDVKTYTLQARVKYGVLRTMAYLSRFSTDDQLALPSTWEKTRKMPPLTIMSWEGAGFDIASVRDTALTCVVHPGLGYDTNRSYEKLLPLSFDARI